MTLYPTIECPTHGHAPALGAGGSCSFCQNERVRADLQRSEPRSPKRPTPFVVRCDWCDLRARWVIVEPDAGGCAGWRTNSCAGHLLRWLPTYGEGVRVEAL